MKTYIAEVTALRERVEELEAQLAAITERVEIGVEWLSRRWGLTRKQARILCALSTGHIMSRDRLASLGCVREYTDVRNIDTTIKHLRRKMPDIKIKSMYGLGYMIDGDELKYVRAAMKPPGDGMDAMQ